MGRASSTKKVSRAASTGGGRTARGAKPWGWYLAMAAVVVLGSLGIGFSRDQRRDALASGAQNEAPVANQDHWHAAYGIYLCNEFTGPLQEQRDPKGIHTHADGIIHIHPFTRASAGKNAVLSVFAEATGLKLTDDQIKVPGGKTFTEGRTKCDGKDAIVQVKVNAKVISNNVGDIRLHDRDHVTIAFAPEGAELPEPPSVAGLDTLSDVTTTTTVPAAGGETTPSTEPGGTPSTDTTATTVPGSPSTTAAG